MPAIARRIIAENNFPTHINQSLENLAKELISGYIQPLSNDTGIDFTAWQKYLEPYKNQRWIDVPWFFAETYFYRYILSLTHYFNPSEWQNLDPFGLQKHQGLEASFDSIATLCHQVNQWLDSSHQQTNTQETTLTTLFYFALWGNRVDLSLWSAFESDRSQFDIESQQANILANDVIEVVTLLTKKPQNNCVDFVIDNAGFELVCDLCLVDFLLGSGLVNQVKLHLKPHPTFVSDAMIKDVHQTINYFASSSNWDVSFFAHRLQEYLELGRLILADNYFWTSPLAFWEIPESLKKELAESSLIIIKGDANYRRLLGDRHWDFTANIADIISYLPVPIVALRTLKSEVAAGIKTEIIKDIAKNDANWLTNGQWGLIQFVGKSEG
ncbi:MAG: protein-glutamate O-methyltransferase family protein [Methylacidiphilales bacterium]|nr:protein-glutamate O-methyltransferase family protein [Candidatus Methylacidiphilales bacterium]NJR17661.1 protein-glutamate O-methyltransferase family protein [Calothrix sp. CSU_2_0]